jgi:CBS domain-containing protein
MLQCDDSPNTRAFAPAVDSITLNRHSNHQPCSITGGKAMKTVGQLLQGKTSGVYTIGPASPVFEALSLMAEREIGALPVVDAGKLVGILSERDYARKVILQGKSSRDTPVREIMTTRVVCVGLQRTVDECLALMTDKRIRHLPVIEHGNLTGLLSIGDLVKEMISEQQHTIAQLESYIHS